MDIHHANIFHTSPDRVYNALTQPCDLTEWMGAPALARLEVGSPIEFNYNQGQRVLMMCITRLEPDRLVQWQVTKPMWPGDYPDQLITWTLSPYENSTLIDFRMSGWPQDDDVYASVSYKWASFMLRLKIFVGDTRDINTFLPLEKLNSVQYT